MIRYIKSVLFTSLFSVITLSVFAQSNNSTATTSSPYSQFGLGLYRDQLLPQNRAMGGIGVGVTKINGYNNVNPLNPASYGSISLTSIDIGVSGSIVELKQTGAGSQYNKNVNFSHVAFGVPVSKNSALSFGLLPYSELGYNYKQTLKNYGTGTSTDTTAINYIYSGSGSLSKAYAGYGIVLAKHFAIGANISYIFGNLRQYQSTEIPAVYGVLNSRTTQSNAIGGINYDYGIQYLFDVAENTHMVLGYSGSASTQINTANDAVITQYTTSAAGDESRDIDTLYKQNIGNGKVKLPLMNRVGFTIQRDGKYMFGADYSIGNWSQLTVAGTNKGLQNSQSFALGGQITPNNQALHNYLALVDYRLGLRYDKTYININNTSINQKTLSFGFGFPLPRNNTAFYKINFATELGQRGTMANSLIRENFINFHIGFTLNDVWFRRYQFD